jgi:hypothetical protein
MSSRLDVSRLEVINSATKYPSIQTYHALGQKGRLTEEATPFDGKVVLTEKINGSNSRIIVDGDGDYLIGSREELLYAKGDRVYPQKPPEQKCIVEALLGLAETLPSQNPDGATVYYLETFGGKIGASAKEYTGGDSVGFRVFDIALIPSGVLAGSRGDAASWRENGDQEWLIEDELHMAVDSLLVGLTPRLGTVDGWSLPTTTESMHQWLKDALPRTYLTLDDGAKGEAEGIVLRTLDRSVIAKARFADYRRTLKE